MLEVAGPGLMSLSAVKGEVSRVCFSRPGRLYSVDVTKAIARKITRDKITRIYPAQGPFKIARKRKLKNGDLRLYVTHEG